MRALYHTQTKKLHGVPMYRNSLYPQLVPFRVVKGCARMDRCVCTSVGAKNSCASVYSLTITKVRARCCGEGHATKSTKAVRSTWCAWCAFVLIVVQSTLPDGNRGCRFFLCGFQILPPRSCSASLSLLVPSIAQLRPHRQIHSDLNAVLIFTQRASASATGWWHIVRRRTPTSRP